MLALLLAASTAYGTGFSVPIPENFSDQDAQAAAVKREGGVLLQQQIPPPVPEAFTANVIVTAVKAADIDSARPAVCQKLGEHRANSGATLLKAGVVPTSFGPVCQIALRVPKKGKHTLSRMTIFAAKGKYSTLTCNYDERDDAARNACDNVVAGFHLD